MASLRPLVRASIQCSSRSATRNRCIQTTIPKTANPISHPTAPGPPPPPPEPSVSTSDERIARKRKQAELLAKGRSLRTDPSRPTAALRKRFWKHVYVKETPEGLQVLLDARPVRTASKDILHIPPSKHALATAIALEWDLLVSTQQALKQHYIPLTSLAARAMDLVKAEGQKDGRIREDITQLAMKYLNTDTLLCWAPEKNIHDGSDEGETLRQLQMKTAQPVIAHLTTKIWPGVEISPILSEDSILPAPQPTVTQQVIRGWVSGLPAFELAGLERAVIATKSLLVATRLLVEWSQEFKAVRDNKQDAGQEARFGIEEAAEACSLEVRWQTGRWGEVEDTHDVEKEDMKRQLGSVVLLVN